MRLYWCLFVPVCLFCTSAACAEQTFPYKAYVVTDEVQVRSGPGKNYYPTDKLKVGQEVEVHRHDPGGWYAIRPPEGSFTWVSSRYLQKKEKGLAVVTGDRVAARVGSQLSDIRDVIQVRLERGEVVEVLGEKQFVAGSEAGTWCKIRPPSGEFRWVFGKYVDAEFPRDGIRRTADAESPLVHPPRRHSSPPPAPEPQPDVAAGPAGPPPPAGPAWQAGVPPAGRAVRHVEPGSITRAGPVATRDGPPPSARASALGPPPVPLGPSPAIGPLPSDTLSMRRISPEEFQAELETLDMQLSVMLAEEPTVWEFGELDTKAHFLLAQAETALERGRTRLLLNKIAQASDIKRRTDEIQATQVEIDRNNAQLAELARRRSGAVRTADARPRFDGSGRLARVVPSKLGAPQYALVDENGAVRCYVTPAPGVNLRYYEGRQVGINGIRGYISEQNAQHLTAKHVAPLEDIRLR